jgi:hypothetical protein
MAHGQETQQGLVADCIRVFKNDVFNRIWTVQEISLARSCHVMCGNCTVDWKTFAEAANTLGYHPDAGEKVFGERVPDFRGFVMHWNLWRTFQMKNFDRKALFKETPGYWDLADAFRYTKFKNATKLEDKVWGMLGILGFETEDLMQLRRDVQTKQAERVVVEEDVEDDEEDEEDEEVEKNDKDNEEDEEEKRRREIRIFAAATFEIIKAMESVKVLLYVAEGQRSFSNVPSWVQDFLSIPSPPLTFRLEQFRASGKSRCTSPQLIGGGLVLRLRGKRMGTIQRCLSGKWAQYKAQSDITVQVSKEDEELAWSLLLLREWMRLALPKRSFWTTDQVTSRFFKIVDPILSDWLPKDPKLKKKLQLSLFCIIWRRNLEQENDMAWIQRFPKAGAHPGNGQTDFSPPENGKIDAELNCIMHSSDMKYIFISLVNKMEQYSVFTVGNDRFGIAFHTITKGDEIILFEASPAPFIVRQSNSTWNLVAPASITGMMDGEEWVSDSHGLQDFEIS